MSGLALKGGCPVRAVPYPAWPVYGERESEALHRVLRSGCWGTLGEEVRRLCRRFAEYQHATYGLAVSNGTVSLEIILRALDIGYGDEVILPPYTFNATCSAIVVVGATPVFADICDQTYNVDPDCVREAITPRTRAVIAVHVGGRMADMTRLARLAKERGLFLIEDAAHAPGSEWQGRRSGSIGEAGSFSFQGSKNLCSGEGGFITTNREDLYEQCWSIHHCGRASRGTAWYAHPIVGTNARMTEWQAAVLDAQLDRLDAQIDQRMSRAEYLDRRLAELGFIGVFPPEPNATRNSYHLYLFKYLREACRDVPRDLFCKALSAEGVPCTTGYRSLHKQGLLGTSTMRRLTGSTTRYDALELPVAERAAEVEGMWFPHPVLLGEEKDLDDIAEAMRKIYENADELRR